MRWEPLPETLPRREIRESLGHIVDSRACVRTRLRTHRAGRRTQPGQNVSSAKSTGEFVTIRRQGVDDRLPKVVAAACLAKFTEIAQLRDGMY